MTPAALGASSSSSQISNEPYIEALDRALLPWIERPVTLDQVVLEVQGAPPLRVASRLRELGATVLPGSLSFSSPPTASRSPELHPAQFEWYFTEATSESLVRLASTGGRTLCMGTPTVAAKFATLGASALLVDNHPLITSRFPTIEMMFADLGEPLSIESRFDTVVLDPPWYREHTLYWLWQASRAVKRGGQIVLSLFPPLFRPTATADRNDILELARSLGTVNLVSGELEYETPLFASETLRRDGLRLSVNWRRGDLLVIRTNASPPTSQPGSLGAAVAWDTFVLGSQVVKVRAGSRTENAPSVAALDGCQDFVLSDAVSLSRLFPSIDVWTSRNRVAAANDRNSLRELLEALSRTSAPADLIRSIGIGSHSEFASYRPHVSSLLALLDLR